MYMMISFQIVSYSVLMISNNQYFILLILFVQLCICGIIVKRTYSNIYLTFQLLYRFVVSLY